MTSQVPDHVLELISKELTNSLFVEKQADGRYKIVTVSTVALPDLEDETFAIQAMDYDSQIAKDSGEYPEYRLFHSKGLGIGKVTKMYRVGIFAVDEGISYDDPFSITAIEKTILDNGDGKWKVSRGFDVFEVAGSCPECDSRLLVERKHLIRGYICPSCGEIHTGYRGILKDVHFTKARTFDVTITDHPAVPYTGASAFPITSLEDLTMTKSQLKKRLRELEIPEELINERLKGMTNDRLKEFSDDIPEATLLKELDISKDSDASDAEEVVMLDDSVLKEFKTMVDTAVEEALETKLAPIVKETVTAAFAEAIGEIEFEVPELDMDGFTVDMSDIPEMKELKKAMADVTKIVKHLLKDDAERLKEIVESEDVPRKGKLRITRHKEGDMEDEEDDEEDDAEYKEEDAIIYTGENEAVVGSLSEFLNQGVPQ